PPADIYTLSLHDALPIFRLQGARIEDRSLHLSRIRGVPDNAQGVFDGLYGGAHRMGVRKIRERAHRLAEGAVGRDRHQAEPPGRDRKSTRLNSSHVKSSY